MSSESSFNPNDTASADSGIFGLPSTLEKSRLVLIPVPWEVTTSYGDGTSRGPEAILNASRQIDLYDIETGDLYVHGYFMEPVSEAILQLNDETKTLARSVHDALESDQTVDPSWIEKVNQASRKTNEWVYQRAKEHLQAGRLIGVIGGDHSSPFGAIRALAEVHQRDFGILHIDAHADLRDAYQGFEHSHASIMFNVMTSELRPHRLVQVGIRDFSVNESAFIQSQPESIRTHFDALTKKRLLRGESWQSICDEIVSDLPSKVYVSFDIDGLSPDLCPSTGTPVPGGLSFDQATRLLATVVEAGKTIVGFDLCEVAPDPKGESEWDGNVGARMLFKLCAWTLASNGFQPMTPAIQSGGRAVRK